MKGALNIGGYKLFGPGNRAVDVAFGGKVNHCLRLISCQGLGQSVDVIHIAADKNMLRLILQAGQILQIACIGQLVIVNDRSACPTNRVENKIRSDKPRSAGYENTVKHGRTMQLRVPACFPTRPERKPSVRKKLKNRASTG